MKNLKKLVLSGMFLALGIVLPFVTGQIPQIGSMLCPMHIPVLLCGFICGWQYGLVVGLIVPVLRSMMFGMPPMFPTATAMAFELMTYGFLAGALLNAVPGIALQLVLIPVIMVSLDKAGIKRFTVNTAQA